MWRDVGKACGWKLPRAPSVRWLFSDERTTPTFLRDTKVGRMTTLEPPEEERGELEELVIELFSQEGGRGSGEEGEEGRPLWLALGCTFPLSRVYISFVFVFP